MAPGRLFTESGEKGGIDRRSPTLFLFDIRKSGGLGDPAFLTFNLYLTVTDLPGFGCCNNAVNLMSGV
jgi:hypothetical protein